MARTIQGSIAILMLAAAQATLAAEPLQLSNSVAPLTITFPGPDTALMTLPNQRTTSLKRYRF